MRRPLQRPLANRERALHGLRGAGALHTRAQAAEEVRFRHRLGKQIALPNLAADGLELVAFVGGLDALGNRPQAEPPSKLHDRLAQPGIVMIFVAVRDITAIDLQLAERQLFQSHQRRIAGAEIVHRKLAFELAQRVGDVIGKIEIIDSGLRSLPGSTRANWRAGVLRVACGKLEA